MKNEDVQWPSGTIRRRNHGLRGVRARPEVSWSLACVGVARVYDYRRSPPRYGYAQKRFHEGVNIPESFRPHSSPCPVCQAGLTELIVRQHTHNIRIIQYTTDKHLLPGLGGYDDGRTAECPDGHGKHDHTSTVACRDDRAKVQTAREADKDKTCCQSVHLW